MGGGGFYAAIQDDYQNRRAMIFGEKQTKKHLAHIFVVKSSTEITLSRTESEISTFFVFFSQKFKISQQFKMAGH